MGAFPDRRQTPQDRPGSGGERCDTQMGAATRENRPIRCISVATIAAAAALLALTCAPRLTAQDDSMPPETAAPAPAAPNRLHAHNRPGAAPPAADQAQDSAQLAGDQAAPDPGAKDATAQAAETPHWPVNEKPGQPVVTWDSHGLSVDASNSSLQQILKDVSMATGAKVEGMSGDQRVFGVYGPAPARDVLSQLLQGAGYNVLMIGDLGQGTPQQILLSVRRASTDSQAPNANSDDDNSGGDDDSAPDNDADDQQAQPPMRPGFPGGFPRTPQQLLEERQRMMQERQQMIQQQMQRQQNNPPQN